MLPPAPRRKKNFLHHFRVFLMKEYKTVSWSAMSTPFIKLLYSFTTAGFITSLPLLVLTHTMFAEEEEETIIAGFFFSAFQVSARNLPDWYASTSPPRRLKPWLRMEAISFQVGIGLSCTCPVNLLLSTCIRIAVVCFLLYPPQ